MHKITVILLLVSVKIEKIHHKRGKVIKIFQTHWTVNKENSHKKEKKKGMEVTNEKVL